MKTKLQHTTIAFNHCSIAWWRNLKKLIDISEKSDFNIEDAPNYYEEFCNAIQNITDFFNLEKKSTK